MGKTSKKQSKQANHLSPHVKRPTIFDLERHTGFSRSTISRAFSQDASIKDDTRSKILKAANEIGYSLHPGARMIRAQRAYRWGLLLPHLENPEYAQLVECFDAEARRAGTHLVLGLTHYDSEVESAFLRHWAAGEADGVITDVVSWEQNKPLFENLLARRYPFLVLYAAPKGLPVIKKDSYDSFCLGLRHLLDLGHKRIAFVGLDEPGSEHSNAHRAYINTLKEYQIDFDESLMVKGPNNRTAGIDAWKQLQALGKNAPTAIMTFNDIIATGVWIAVHSQGLSIPKDISLIGNDDIPEARLMGITSVSYDRIALAKQAIGLLEQMRSTPETKPQELKMKTELIMRGSIGPPKKLAH
ncbi:LacI family DNA-binding transcriptional regulator [Cerasicoccus maritimus]|uniref:LacI family DNA-binding transcriptional regulator n=1 Tax=Cerasicoccus maritimus TaxID=490089 RepID=UPI0028527A03|nr:LacI family DNA-binding transcriptional regulator [Cerasicoccus maritimus]